jgi:hypothetical protein
MAHLEQQGSAAWGLTLFQPRHPFRLKPRTLLRRFSLARLMPTASSQFRPSSMDQSRSGLPCSLPAAGSARLGGTTQGITTIKSQLTGSAGSTGTYQLDNSPQSAIASAVTFQLQGKIRVTLNSTTGLSTGDTIHLVRHDRAGPASAACERPEVDQGHQQHGPSNSSSGCSMAATPAAEREAVIERRYFRTAPRS